MQIKKQYVENFYISLLISFGMYLIFSFILKDLNPFEWDSILRFFLVLISFVVSTITIAWKEGKIE